MSPDRNVSTPSQYLKLEQRLVLLAWLNSLLGHPSNRDLLSDTQNATEGFDASRRSFLYLHLRGRESQVKIPPDDLERYDENIRTHLAAINRHRAEPITLRYFHSRPTPNRSVSRYSGITDPAA